MFKFIGIIVVVAVLYLGFDSLQKWYTGDATPQEAVSEVRKRVGETLVGEKTTDSTRQTQPSQSAKPGATPQGNKPLDTDEMLRDMMKK